MRGFHPSNNSLVLFGHPRIVQAFANMVQLAKLGVSDLVRLLNAAMLP
jgi:hypothetical protein